MQMIIFWALIAREIALISFTTTTVCFGAAYHPYRNRLYTMNGYQYWGIDFRLIGYQSLVFNSFLDTITRRSCLVILLK